MKVMKYNFHKDMTAQKQSSLVRVKQKFQVTLPVEVRKALHLQEGDLLEALIENNRIFLNPKVVVDRSTLDAAFEDGVRDYRKGRGAGPFANVKEFTASRKR